MEFFDLRAKRVFVVGGTRSIGRAITLGMARAGAHVAVAARTEKDLGTIADEIEACGTRSATVRLDVSDIDAIPAAVDHVNGELGGIDVLVNVAGTTVRKPIEEFTPTEYDQIMDVNFKGIYFLCKEVGAQMMERRSGKVINIASLATAIGLPKITVYAGSKGAIGQFTRALAVEWAPYNIQVNALAPGFIATDINRQVYENDEFKSWVENRTPAGRAGRSEDMVGTALFLAAAASDFVTGQVIYVDGGVMAGSYWPV